MRRHIMGPNGCSCGTAGPVRFICASCGAYLTYRHVQSEQTTREPRCRAVVSTLYRCDCGHEQTSRSRASVIVRGLAKCS